MRATLPLTLAVLLSLPAAAAYAQVTKTVTGEVKTMTGTVEAIETSSREVTVKKADGTYTVVDVPHGAKRFDNLKIGDKVSFRYYENVVLRLKAPGEKDTDTSKSALTPAPGSGPAGTFAKQRTITATITAIDPAVPSITFTGPNNWKYSSRVEDKKALAKVKVGDKVEITWTAATLVSFDEK
jgi:Cu/Ag efflux protein CusF